MTAALSASAAATPNADAAIIALSDRCNRCGFCQEVCPTYRQTGDELAVARGRIQLLRQAADGRRDWLDHPETVAAVDRCLLCRACVVNCPAAVATDELVMAARRSILARRGFSLFHRLVYQGLLSRPERLAQVGRLLELRERIGAVQAVERRVLESASGRLRHWIAHIPEPAAPPARRSLAAVHHPPGRARWRVAYFLGCATNAFQAPAARAAVRLLQRAGCRVDIPPATCCGGPHRSAGDLDTARRLARRNLGLLTREPWDWIVSDCATCTHALHDYPAFFAADDPAQEQAARLAARVIDWSTLLAEHLPPLPGLAPRPGRVTYHDPCHAVRGLGVRETPRELLRRIPGVELVEMQGADVCCGGAGAYGFLHADLSRSILEAKVAAVAATQADVVATACPSCLLQLAGGLKAGGLAARARHPLELMAGSAGLMPDAP
jgi:glycolate oxidase iron-sulfur subunit